MAALRFVFIFIIASALLLGGFLFISTKTNLLKPSAKEVTLKYWGFYEPATVKLIIEDYQKTHPKVKISYEKFPPQNYRETLQTRIKDNRGPDIFRFHASWVPTLKAELSPLPKEIMDDKNFTEAFYQIAAENLKSEGNFVGIPLEYDSLALIYNSDLLKAAGLEKPPATWNELRFNYAPKLAQRDETGRLTVAAVALGSNINVDYSSDILGLMMLQNGVSFFDNGKVSFDKSLSSDTPPRNLGADALTFFTLFVNQDRVWDETLPNSIQAFANGKVAMIFAPSAKIFEIIKTFQSSGKQINFGVAPVPQLISDSNKKVSWASYWAEGVSTKSKFKKEAWEFLKFLSEKETLRALHLEIRKEQTFSPIPSRKDLSQELLTDSFLAPYVSEAPYAKNWYMNAFTFDNGLNDKIIEEFSIAIQEALKGSDAKGALVAAGKNVEQILTQFNLIQPQPTKKP